MLDFPTCLKQDSKRFQPHVPCTISRGIWWPFAPRWRCSVSTNGWPWMTYVLWIRHHWPLLDHESMSHKWDIDGHPMQAPSFATRYILDLQWFHFIFGDGWIDLEKEINLTLAKLMRFNHNTNEIKSHPYEPSLVTLTNWGKVPDQTLVFHMFWTFLNKLHTQSTGLSLTCNWRF